MKIRPEAADVFGVKGRKPEKAKPDKAKPADERDAGNSHERRLTD